MTNQHYLMMSQLESGFSSRYLPRWQKRKHFRSFFHRKPMVQNSQHKHNQNFIDLYKPNLLLRIVWCVNQRVSDYNSLVFVFFFNGDTPSIKIHCSVVLSSDTQWICVQYSHTNTCRGHKNSSNNITIMYFSKNHPFDIYIDIACNIISSLL